MFRTLVAIAVVASVGVVVAAPARVVRGVVTIVGSSRPIAGATVLTDHGELVVSDLDGYFAINVTPADRDLTITAPGYATRTVHIAAGDALLRIELAAASGSEVIEVHGKAPEQTKPLTYQLSADEIRFLPGAANDVLRAAQVLPGVARIPYSFGGLVLRGTSPRDTAVFLDGIEVPIAFHFGGVTSFYPGTMLESLSLANGGFDVSHGGAQGGLVTLSTREPRTDRWRVGGSIGLLDSSVFAEGPWKGGGVIMGVRRSYLDTVISPFVAEDVPLPSYWDAQIRTSFGDPLKRGRITPMIFTSVDRVSSSKVEVSSFFVRAAVPYMRSWGPLTLRLVPWLGWTQLQLTEYAQDDTETNDTIRRPQVQGGVRSELIRDYTWGHIRGGIDLYSAYLSQVEVDVGSTRGRKLGAELLWSDLAGWVETRIKINGDNFAVKPGVRVEAYGLSEQIVVDPRINIHQRLTDVLTMRQAIGRYHQPPIPADVDPFDGNPRLQASYMDQASLGLDAELYPGVVASLTGFAGYGNLIGVEVPHGNDTNLDPNTGGLGPTFQLLLEKQLGFSSFRENLGRARLGGLEALLKGNVKRWFFLFGYTLAWSQRTDDPAQGRGWRPFELDQRHNLNVAASYRFNKWRLGARIQFVSGNPYSPTPIGTDVPEPIPFGGRLPPFFALDLRLDHKWSRCWGDINLYFDIQNATNRRNVEGREFGSTPENPGGADQDIPGLPIVPFIGVEFVPR